MEDFSVWFAVQISIDWRFLSVGENFVIVYMFHIKPRKTCVEDFLSLKKKVDGCLYNLPTIIRLKMPDMGEIRPMYGIIEKSKGVDIYGDRIVKS